MNQNQIEKLAESKQQIARKALQALYLQVDSVIATDIQVKVLRAFDELKDTAANKVGMKKDAKRILLNRFGCKDEKQLFNQTGIDLTYQGIIIQAMEEYAPPSPSDQIGEVFTEEDMKGAYGCGWGDCVVHEGDNDNDIMLKKFKEFMKRMNNIKNYLDKQTS